MSFWKELRRRHIFRIAAVYAATAWLVLQLGAIVFPALHAPSWCLPVLIGFIALGFPVALVLAWAFEVTPEGVRRTEAGDADDATSPHNRRRVGQVLNIAIIVILAAAVGVLSWQLTSRDNPAMHTTTAGTKAPVSLTSIPANSIAVLPFLDLSPQHNQAYFAQGIAEQLLDILAQTTRLRVAARTSAFQFQGKSESVTKIGKVLHVRHVLEGSVLRDGNLVRIAVQLVDTDSGYQEWSHTYQRKMTDIFKVQDAITRAIADALEIRFSASGSTSAIAKADPATKPAAYEEYLLGRYLLNQRFEKSLREALVHFKKAIALDPDYAPAYAQTAIVYTLLTAGPETYGNYTEEQATILAKPYLKRAMSLAPNAPETQAAQGRLDVLAFNSKSALKHFKNAVKGNPSYMDAVTWLAGTYQFLGLYQKALAVYQAGSARDPLNWVLNDNYMNALLTRRRFEQAEAIAKRFLGIAPSKGHMMLGDVEAAEGNPAHAMKNYLTALTSATGRTDIRESIIDLLNHAQLYKNSVTLRQWNDGGFGAALAGKKDEAVIRQKSILKSWHGILPHIIVAVTDIILEHREQARQQFDLAWKDSHNWSWPNAELEYVALLREAGATDKANTVFRTLQKIVDEHHENAVAAGIDWPNYLWLSAGIEILKGDRDAGLSTLHNAVNHPSYYTTIPRPWHSGSLYLKLAPQFDSVRHDPRFAAIVALEKRQEAALRAEILPILCNWHYPPGGWHPLPATCTGVPKSASVETTNP